MLGLQAICLLWKKNIISAFSGHQLYPLPFLWHTQEFFPKGYSETRTSVGEKRSYINWVGFCKSSWCPVHQTLRVKMNKQKSCLSPNQLPIEFAAGFPFFFWWILSVLSPELPKAINENSVTISGNFERYDCFGKIILYRTKILRTLKRHHLICKTLLCEKNNIFSLPVINTSVRKRHIYFKILGPVFC